MDEYGLLLDTPRILGENNADYKKRLLEVFSLRAGSAYNPLLNGILRDFGLSKYKAFTIDWAGSSSNYSWYIKAIDDVMYFYSDKNTLQGFINLRRDSWFTVTDLVNEINNSTSLTFSATPVSGADIDIPAYCIPAQNSLEYVLSAVPASSVFEIQYEYVDFDTLFFSEKDVFNKRVDDINADLEPGDYRLSINVASGKFYTKVETFTQPSGKGKMEFRYRKIPFNVIVSPISISKLENYKNSRQIIKSAAPIFWGK